MDTKQIDIDEMMIRYNSEFWLAKTDINSYPLLTNVEPRLCKLWQFVDGNNYIWVDGNDKAKAMERYIKALDVITEKSKKELPHGLKKMLARVFVRYRLDPELLNLYETKEGYGHASYNRIRNSMRLVSDYYRRFGVIRLGGVLIPEFHKTIIHEYGHMLWHTWLSEDEKKKFAAISPEFKKSNNDVSGWYRPSVVSIDGNRSYSNYIIPIGTMWISEQELLSPKECFAETFAIYTIDPKTLKEKFPERYDYMNNVVDTDQSVLSADSVEKADVRIDGGTTHLSDFIPIDLQTSKHRIVLANQFEQKLIALLGQLEISGDKVKNIIPLAPFSSADIAPPMIKCAVYVLALHQRHCSEYKFGNVTIHLFNNEEKFNTYVINSFESYKERAEAIISKRRKHRPHQTLMGRSGELPKGHAAPLPQAGTLSLQRPLQTKYVVQEHLAEKAGKHLDFRIKVGDSTYSWVLPKGFPKRGQRRLAILQPPHEAKYMGFSGRIASGYGKGNVRIADAGPVEVKDWEKNKKVFTILSGPNEGSYGLVRGKKRSWYVVPIRKKPIPKQYKMKDYRMKVKKRMLTSRRFSVQPRLGGPKVMLYVGARQNRILTRTSSGKQRGMVERTDNYPHLRDVVLGKPGTVIEGEIYAYSPKISTAFSLSKPMRSRMLQRKFGKPKFYANDLVALEGEDVRALPYSQRLKMLRRILPSTKYVKKLPVVTTKKRSKLRDWFSRGYHGAYVIDRRAPYDEVSGLYLSSGMMGKSDRSDDIEKFWGSPEEVKDWYTTTTGKPYNLGENLSRERKPIKDQYPPSKVRLKFKDKMWKDKHFVLQPKLDGSRYLLYVGGNENRLLSRRISERTKGGHVERTDNVPHLRDAKIPFKDSILDGEVIRRDFRTTQRIMGSSPSRSLMLQNRYGKPAFVVYDILRFKGKDVRKLPYEKRLSIVEQNVIPMNNEHIKVMPTFAGSDKKKQYGRLIRMGYEGIVLKDKRGKYDEAFMTKKTPLKRGEFVVMGFTKGRGKNKDKIGAIRLGQWSSKRKELVPMGKVGTGLTDKERDWWTKYGDKTIGRTVIEVKYMRKTHKGLLRAPVFSRIRLDKSPKQTGR